MIKKILQDRLSYLSLSFLLFLVALSLALFAYNKGLPLSMRSMFYPLLGERVWGWPGHIIDTLAVFATLFRLATSLGLGAEQANAGLEYLVGFPEGDTSKVLLIIGITAIALTSVVAGLDKGVKRLSEINMVLAALLITLPEQSHRLADV